MGEKVLLTIPEAAEALGVGRSFFYELVHRGEIASLKLGRSRRVAATELGRYVERLQASQADADGGA